MYDTSTGPGRTDSDSEWSAYDARMERYARQTATATFIIAVAAVLLFLTVLIGGIVAAVHIQHALQVANSINSQTQNYLCQVSNQPFCG